MAKFQRVDYRDGGIAIFSTKAASMVDESTQAKDPTAATNLWVKWGSNNLFPKEVQDDLRKSTVGKRALKVRTAVHFGTGLITYKKEVQDGKIVKSPVIDPDADFFIQENSSGIQQSAIIRDLETYYNSFVEFIFDKTGTKILKYRRIKAIWCRYEAPFEGKGAPKAVFISQKWPNPSEEYFEKIPILDPEDPFKYTKCVIPLSYITSDDGKYYELADWDPVRQNGWMEIASMVPELKKSILENAGIIRYHVEIPSTYWPLRFPDWDTLTEEARAEKAASVYDSINENLFSREASGKSLFSQFQVDELGKDYAGWKITAIDNKLFDGLLNVDSKASNAEVLFALGVPPALIGLLPGASESGSGSNIRENLAMLQAMAGMDREVSLYPLYLIKRLNGWDPSLHFGYGDLDTSVTLDKNPTGKQNTLR